MPSKGSTCNGIHGIEQGAALDQLVLSSWKWKRPKRIDY